MWKIEKKFGEETLYKCSECGYQVAAKAPPTECPHCGEITPRTIDLNRSTMELDAEEIGVYEYERDTPIYKLWYFWVILLVTIALVGGGLYFLRSRTPAEEPTNTDSVGEISFTAPTGWSKESDTLFKGPGEGSSIKIKICRTARNADVDEYAGLVADLSGIDEIEEKEYGDIEGRLLQWKTVKVVDGEEIYTDYARYVFIYKSNLYVVMYKSADDAAETFETFLGTLNKS